MLNFFVKSTWVNYVKTYASTKHYNQCGTNRKYEVTASRLTLRGKYNTKYPPLCCVASSVSNLTKHGDRTLCLAVVLAQAGVSLDGAHLLTCRGRVKLPGHYSKLTPAGRGRRSGDSSYVAQNCLNLLPRAPRDHGSKGHQRNRIPRT